MEITRKRIRKDFAPLNAAVSLVCRTNGSPMTQTFNGKTGSYEPNRQLTPTVILPQVTVNANDGSLSSPYGNAMLASMQWLVNGVDITTIEDAPGEEAQYKWQGNYTIRMDGSNRGALELRRNVKVSEKFELQFKGVIADQRLGVTIPIETDTVTLATNDASEDDYAISLGEDTIIQYDPSKDRLHRYNYKVAHGLTTADPQTEVDVTDENAYRRDIPVFLYRGASLCTEAFTFKVYRVNSTTSFTLIDPTADDNELIEVTQNSITLDLRLITKADYLVRAYIANKEVARQQFSVNRLYPVYRIRTTNGTAIAPDEIERYDEAMVDCDGNVVECPESIIKMIWKTDTAAKTGVTHNEGGTTLFMLEKTGIGNTYTDDWLDTYIDAEHKPAHGIAADSSGNIYTDENGTPYIFN